MMIRFRAAACLASFIALVASREHAAAAYQVDRLGTATTILSTDGSTIRMAQDDQSTSSTQATDGSDSGDDSAQSNSPTQSPQ
jgi:hypothetical protein